MGLALEPTSSTALGLLLLQLWTQRGRRAREVVALQTSSAHLHHQVSLFLVVHLILDKCDLGGESRRGAEHLGACTQVQWSRLVESLAVDPLGSHQQTAAGVWKVKDEVLALGATRHKEQRLGGSRISKTEFSKDVPLIFLSLFLGPFSSSGPISFTPSCQPRVWYMAKGDLHAQPGPAS